MEKPLKLCLPCS